MGKWGDAYGHVGNTTQIASSAFWAEGTLVINGALLLPIQRLMDGSHVVSSSLPRPQDHPLFYVGVYTLISVAAGLANVLSLVVQFIGALRASRLLFKRLVVAVIHATMRWHVSHMTHRSIINLISRCIAGHHPSRTYTQSVWRRAV